MTFCRLVNTFINKHSLKRLLVVLLVMVSTIAVILLVREFVFRPTTDYPGSYFNRGKNAVWLGVEWVSEPHSDAEIVTLANDLAHRQIHYVYAYASYLRTDSVTFNPQYSDARAFVKSFKKAQPGMKLLAWLGLPMPSLGGAANLADATIRQKITTISAYFVHDMGFDGIQLDPETVVSGDQNLIALLDETRQSIGSTAFLSLAAEKNSTDFP